MTALASPPDQVLQQAFADWKKNVLAELNGVPFEKKLVTRTFEDLSLQPLYTRADLSGLKDLESLSGQPPFLRGTRKTPGRGWTIAQEIPLSVPSEYNKALLAHLSGGQDAVVLRASQSLQADAVSLDTLQAISTALEGVDIQAVPVHLAAGRNVAALAALYLGFVQDRGVPFAALRGTITTDPLSEAAVIGEFPADLGSCYDNVAEWVRWTAVNVPRIRSIGVDAAISGNAGATATQELAVALAAATEYLKALLNRGVSLTTAARAFGFQFSVGSQFFTEIAKFRAFRPLWTRVISAFGAHAALAAEASVHVATTTWDKTLLDPHVNMLRATTEALSAVLGGCDSLHIAAFDEVAGKTTEFSRRIALNIHTLLAEEFGFASPADPAGGSWYVEKLTDDLARSAWSIFQEIEKRGGFAACLGTGYIQQLVDRARATKATAVATRRVSLVGTNLFPNLKETALSRATHTPTSSATPRTEFHGLRTGNLKFELAMPNAIKAALQGASRWDLENHFDANPAASTNIAVIKPWRAAEGFEALRRASAAYAATKGTRPKVFLARMGPPLQHKARTDFSAAFFAVGGFETTGTAKFEDASAAAEAAVQSGSQVAVLCSTDETYPALAPVFAHKIKSLDATRLVVLAGLPADPGTVAAYSAAGFDEFIHVRANVQEILASFLRKIGAVL